MILHNRQCSFIFFCMIFKTCFLHLFCTFCLPVYGVACRPSLSCCALAIWEHVMNIIYHVSVFRCVKYDDILYHDAYLKTASLSQFDDQRVSLREFLSTRCFYTRVATIGTFAYLLGTRVGEASHPGPKTSFAVINPAALYGKTSDVQTLESDVVICSETSVTKASINAF